MITVIDSVPPLPGHVAHAEPRRRWRPWCLGLALVGVLFTSAAASVPFWLIVDQSPSTPVTLVVPVGPSRSLFDAAATWVHEGRASRIVIHDRSPGRFESRGLAPSVLALFTTACDRHGLEASQRVELAEIVRGTRHLGRQLNWLLGEHPEMTIAVLGPRLQTRSLRWKLDQELEPQNRQRLSVVAVPEPGIRTWLWMTDRSSTRAMIDAGTLLLAQSLARKSLEWTPRTDEELRSATVAAGSVDTH